MKSQATNKSIIFISGSFYPAVKYGGPIFSDLDMATMFRSFNFKVKIHTTNSSDPTNLSIKIKKKNYIFNGIDISYHRYFLNPNFSFCLWFKSIPDIKFCDIIHITGTYSLNTIFAILISRLYHKPIIWSPRGGLLATHSTKIVKKKMIKKLFENFLKIIVGSNLYIRATSEIEKTNISSIFRIGSKKIINIPNFPYVFKPSQLPKNRLSNKKINFIYIGRIDPIKGIERLINPLLSIKFPFIFKIYGYGDIDYVNYLKKKI